MERGAVGTRQGGLEAGQLQEPASVRNERPVRYALTRLGRNLGTLVRVGQRIATALHGGARWDWVPFLLLWIGLAAGGALGALMFLRLGVTALWAAAAVVGGLALLSLLDERRPFRAGS